MSKRSWRFVFVGIAIICLPRLPSLLAQSQLHNILFPIFLGLTLGRLLPGIRTSFPGSLHDEPGPRHAGYFTLGLIALMLIVSLLSIFQYADAQGSLSNRVLLPGMSTHYAMFLAATLSLNLLAPLLWISSERIAAPQDLSGTGRGPKAVPIDPAQVANALLFGITLGVVAYCLSAVGQGSIPVLNAGIADHGLEVGRLPGLFSDSGASGVLLPSVLMMASIWLSPGRRTVSASLFLIAFLLLMPFQGRVIWLGLLGVLLALPFCFKQLHLSPRPLILGVFLFASFLIVILFLKRYNLLDTRVTFEAMQSVDSVRSALIEWSLEIFWKSPWIGHGLNSFIPQLMELKSIHPEIYPENSPGFIPGVLTDLGLLGYCAVVLLLGRYLRLLAQTMSTPAFGHIHVRALAFLPIALAPTFLVGYHILHPEVAAFVLLPLLIVPPGR
ncbi:MAG: O-antigen ligase family protein [Leptospirales bacterium]|nr:O-antigen ligase family protein [Leptospirales bacterium]